MLLRTSLLALTMLFAGSAMAPAGVILTVNNYSVEANGGNSSVIATNSTGGNNPRPGISAAMNVSLGTASASSSLSALLSPVTGPGPQSLLVDLNVKGQRSAANAFASGKVDVNGKFELDEPYDYLLTGDLDTEFGALTIQGIGGPETLNSTGTLLAGSYNFSATLARGTSGETFSFDELLQFNLTLTPASVVPEPGSLVLFGGILGAAGWWYHGRRRRLPG